MRAHFTPQAEIDLEEVGDYIALDNPGRAVSFIREIRQHCEKIAGGPDHYAARPDLGDTIRIGPLYVAPKIRFLRQLLETPGRQEIASSLAATNGAGVVAVRLGADEPAVVEEDAPRAARNALRRTGGPVA